jgi:hypothetical protein
VSAPDNQPVMLLVVLLSDSCVLRCIDTQQPCASAVLLHFLSPERSRLTAHCMARCSSMCIERMVQL